LVDVRSTSFVEESCWRPPRHLFVPKEWADIKCFSPVDLQVKKDFPFFEKVRLRPVNPIFNEHAKKEFERQTGHIFLQKRSVDYTKRHR